MENLLLLNHFWHGGRNLRLSWLSKEPSEFHYLTSSFNPMETCITCNPSYVCEFAYISSYKRLFVYHFRLMPDSALAVTKEKRLSGRQWFESGRASAVLSSSQLITFLLWFCITVSYNLAFCLYIYVHL